MTTPAAGVTHDLVLRYGTTASPSYQGIMLRRPGDNVLIPFVMEQYNPFNPALRAGEATVRDMSVLATWEKFKTLNGGIGQLLEPRAESQKYAYAQGSPSIYTAQEGHLLPPPAAYAVDSTRKDLKQYLECQFSGGTKMMALSNASPGVVYDLNSTGFTFTARETLTAAGKHMIFDGATQYVTQGSANAVRKTTDGTTWSNHTFNADFTDIRTDGTISYVYQNSSVCTLVPGGSYSTITVGWSATTATNMKQYRGALFVFKPEGIYRWADGAIDKFFDASNFYSTSNGTNVAVHDDIMWFSMQNRLFFSNGSQTKELFPADINGFVSIDSLTATNGPLILGARINPRQTGGTTDEQSQLFMINGVASPGLNPLMSIAYQSTSSSGSPGTLADDATVGTVAWTNASNAASSNDTYATVALDNAAQSHYLKATNFGFAVPTGATITGVKVDVEYKLAVGSVSVNSAKLVKGGSITGNSIVGVGRNTTTEAYSEYGSASQMWGLSLSASDVNASNFGAVVTFTVDDPPTTDTVSVDHIRVTVFYNLNLNKYIGAGATSIYDTNGVRLYCTESTTDGVKYLDLTTRYRPKTFTTHATASAATEFIELTEESEGFEIVKKWGHDAVLTVRNPSSTTFAQVWYSHDGGTWTQMLDNSGSAVTLTLSSNNVGCYFPNNATWTHDKYRIYYWTSVPNTAAEILRFTVRGLVMTKSLYRFTFPIIANERVDGLTPEFSGDNAEYGDTIWRNIMTAAEQGYPCDIQTFYKDSSGNPLWYRVAFQGTPRVAPTYMVVNDATGEKTVMSVIQANLMEINALSSTGAYNAWAAG